MSTNIVQEAAGDIASAGSSDITFDQAGVVRLEFGPEQVARFERIGNDLLLVLRDGRTITIRNFFLVDEDGERRDLVLEDADGVGWWGQYTSPWSEFDFTRIQHDPDPIPAASAVGGLPAWAKTALGVAGGAGLLHRLGNGDDPLPDTPAPAANRAPTIADDAQSIAEDGVLAGRVEGIDADGDALTYARGSDPLNGTVVVNADGTYIYTPTPDFHGTDSFTVTASDGRGGTATGTITVTVTPVNDAPVAANDGPVAVIEDTPVSGNVLDNDSDVDGDTLTVTRFTVAGDPTVYSAGQTATIAGIGTLMIDASGDYTFTPAQDYNGPVPTATYTVSDGSLSDTAQLSFAGVTPVNDAPVAPSIVQVSDEDAAGFSIDLLANATDVDGDPLSIANLVETSGGDASGVTVSGSTLLVDPAAYNHLAEGENATLVYSYDVSDGQGGVTATTATVIIEGRNDAPLMAAPVTDTGGILTKPQTGTNHGIATALSLDGGFVLGNNPDVGNSATIPFVSIHGTGGGGADYYAFTVTEAGSLATFDVDYAYTGPGGFDSYLHLWDSDGNRISSNDDAPTGLGGGGSVSAADAYLSYTFSQAGTYYISIGRPPGHANPDNGVPSGATYQLQVSLENALMSGHEAELTDHTDGSTDDLSVSRSIAFADDDLNDTHSVTASLLSATHSVTGPGATAAGGLSAVIGDSATGDGVGTVDWSFTAPEAELAHLAEGESLVQVYRITVTDSSGATSYQDVTITLHGTDDAPVPSPARADAIPAVEDGDALGLAALGGANGWPDMGMAEAAALPHLDALLPGDAHGQCVASLLPDGDMQPAWSASPAGAAPVGGPGPYAAAPVNPADELEQPALDLV